MGLTGSSYYNPWIPHKFESRLLFWLTITYQSLGGIVTGQASASGDTFIVAMMLQISAQLEILTHRMQIFPEVCETKFSKNTEMQQIFLNEWVQHHISLYG